MMHPDLSGIESRQIDFLTYYLPANNLEIKQLFHHAQRHKKKIVVRGAAHSFPLIARQEADYNILYVTLAKMYAVQLDPQSGLVTVEAGCHLGCDPFDPTDISSVGNSLLSQLDPLTQDGHHQFGAQGWALPDLGGISHQTVGGFMATGSSGGSLTYSFERAIRAVTVMTYRAEGVVTHTYCQPGFRLPGQPPEAAAAGDQPSSETTDDLNDQFYAVAFAHRGLLGIVTQVVFQCEPTYDIMGSEIVSSLNPPYQCPINLFGDPDPDPVRPTLTEFLQGRATDGADYSRLVWWPQPGLERIVIWQANRMPVADEGQHGPFPQPYKEVPYYFGSPLLSTLEANVALTTIGQWQTWLSDLLGTNNSTYKKLLAVGQNMQPLLMRYILEQFVPLSTPKQQFSDVWWKGLPMDNQIGDQLFPVWFTELWIPLDRPGKAEEVMAFLRTYYQDAQHPERAGTFCCEIYAAPTSKFWMSPSYECDVLRLDFFWFAKNTNGRPQDYYQQFWQELAQFNYRPHWGKYLPLDPDYLRRQYRRWDEVLALRGQLDPHNLFLTNYWQQYLGVSV